MTEIIFKGIQVSKNCLELENALLRESDFLKNYELLITISYFNWVKVAKIVNELHCRSIFFMPRGLIKASMEIIKSFEDSQALNAQSSSFI